MESSVFKDKAVGICGALLGEAAEITLYAEKETGRVFYFCEYEDKVKRIDGIRLSDAEMCVDDRLVINKLISGEYGEGVIGAVFCREYAVMITSDCSAEKRSYEDLSRGGNSDEIFQIDIR